MQYKNAHVPLPLSLSYQTMISKLANYFNITRNTNYCTNNVSNGVALLQAIYFIATAVAPSAFKPTQKTSYTLF